MADAFGTGYYQAAARAQPKPRTVTKRTSAFEKYGTGYMDPRIAQAIARSLYPLDPRLAYTSDAQMRSQANAQVQPYYNQMTDYIKNQINARSKAGSAAIQGYTGEAMNRMKAIAGEIDQGYDQGITRQAALNDSLTNFVQAQGKASSDQLGAMEAAAGQTDAGSQYLTQLANGAAGAQAGMGYGAMTALVSDAAAAHRYGNSLPASASWQGQAALGNLQGELNNDLNTQLGQLRTQMPQTIQDVYNNLMDREMQKAGLRQTNQSNIADYLVGIQRQNYEYGIYSQEAKQKAAATSQAASQQRFDNKLAAQQLANQTTSATNIIHKAVKTKNGWQVVSTGQVVPSTNSASGAAAANPLQDSSTQGFLQGEASRLLLGSPGSIGPLGTEVGGSPPVLKPADPKRRTKFIKRMTSYAKSLGIPANLASQWAVQFANAQGLVDGQAGGPTTGNTVSIPAITGGFDPITGGYSSIGG